MTAAASLPALPAAAAAPPPRGVKAEAGDGAGFGGVLSDLSRKGGERPSAPALTAPSSAEPAAQSTATRPPGWQLFAGAAAMAMPGEEAGAPGANRKPDAVGETPPAPPSLAIYPTGIFLPPQPVPPVGLEGAAAATDAGANAARSGAAGSAIANAAAPLPDAAPAAEAPPRLRRVEPNAAQPAGPPPPAFAAAGGSNAPAPEGVTPRDGAATPAAQTVPKAVGAPAPPAPSGQPPKATDAAPKAVPDPSPPPPTDLSGGAPPASAQNPAFAALPRPAHAPATPARSRVADGQGSAAASEASAAASDAESPPPQLPATSRVNESARSSRAPGEDAARHPAEPAIARSAAPATGEPARTVPETVAATQENRLDPAAAIAPRPAQAGRGPSLSVTEPAEGVQESSRAAQSSASASSRPADNAPAVAVRVERAPADRETATLSDPLAPMRQVADAVMRSVLDQAGEAAAAAPASAAPAPQAAPSAAPMRSLTVELSPADLGTVAVRMRLSGGRLEMHVEVEKRDTLSLMDRDREVLSKALGERGYGLDTLTIRAADPAQQTGGFAQHGAADNGNARADSAFSGASERGGQRDDAPAGRSSRDQASSQQNKDPHETPRSRATRRDLFL